MVLKKLSVRLKIMFLMKKFGEFQKIDLYNKKESSLKFIEIKENQEFIFNKKKIMPFKANHTEGAFGYKISKNKFCFLCYFR